MLREGHRMVFYAQEDENVAGPRQLTGFENWETEIQTSHGQQWRFRKQ